MKKKRDLMPQTFLLTCGAIIVCQRSILAAPPVIHLQWDNGPQQPIKDTHYTLDTLPPASADYPDVKLLEGRPDWRVWSTDLDAADGVGDIGTISSPADDDFTLKLAANGSADRIMLYGGTFIDGLGWGQVPNEPTNHNTPAWIAFKENTLPDMKAAGFTHLCFQISTPTVVSDPTNPPSDPGGWPRFSSIEPGAMILSFVCELWRH